MKKLQILIIIFLISLAVCTFVSIQSAKAAQSNITLNPNTGHIGDTITVSGTGFAILQPITIKFDGTTVPTSPPAQGGIDGSFSGASFTVPTTMIGSHTVSATDGTNSGNAQFTLTSTLTAPTISASPSTVDQTQTSTLSSTTVVTGTSPYTYQWIQKAPGTGSFSPISGATSSGYSFVTTSSTTIGSWSFELQVTDLASAIVTSNAVSVTVSAIPTVGIAPVGPLLMDAGQNQVFTATPGGGYGTLSYQWYSGSTPVSGANSLTYTYTASGASVSITCKVTDSAPTPITSTSNTVAITVSATPTVNITPVGPLSIDAGQAQTFTAAPSGGSGTIHFQWYLGGSAVSGASGSTYSFSRSVGSYSVTCKVTDSAYTPITSVDSNAVAVTVNSALVAPTASATPSTMNKGQTSTLASTAVTTGTSPYTYQWLSEAPGESSFNALGGATSSSYSFVTDSSTANGIWSFELKVTDVTGASITSNVATVSVTAALTVSVSPTSWSMDVGQSKTFIATASGGSGSYSSTGYQWYVGGSAQSGATSSTFSYSLGSIGSYLITVTVTDSLGSTSAPSSPASVVVSASPTVSIAPAGPITLDTGQIQVFTATYSGGSGSLSYQWSVDGNAVGSNSASYSYTATASSHSITCKVTDGASTPVTSSSNAVSITANSALLAPTVSASPNTINQGQTSILTSPSVTTGTSPYNYQWFEKVPSGTYTTIGSNSPSFSFVTSGTMVTGSWSFILQVKDASGNAVNSTAVSVTVNTSPLDHFIFASFGVQTAGTPFSITITAKNAFNNTLTNYSGTNALNVSIGTINPTITGNFINGVWTGSVTVTGAGSGVWLSASGSGMTGTSGSFTVNPGILDHFTFSSISDQSSGSPFNIAVTAQDAFNNTVKSYVGTPSLTCSAGSINPSIMTAFVGGAGSTLVTIASSGFSVTITATDGSHTGTSNSFTVTLAATSSPTPSPSPLPTPTPSTGPTASPQPTLTPAPTPVPNAITITTLTDSGQNVSLTFQGDITSSTISSISITTDGSNTTTTVSLAIVAQSKTNGFNNVTIPISAIPYGTTPTVYVNNGVAQNQGYSHDSKNYYIWFKTDYSTYELSVAFETQPAPANFPIWVILAIVIIVVVSILAVFLQKTFKTKNFRLEKYEKIANKYSWFTKS